MKTAEQSRGATASGVPASPPVIREAPNLKEAADIQDRLKRVTMAYLLSVAASCICRDGRNEAALSAGK